MDQTIQQDARNRIAGPATGGTRAKLSLRDRSTTRNVGMRRIAPRGTASERQRAAAEARSPNRVNGRKIVPIAIVGGEDIRSMTSAKAAGSKRGSWASA